MTMMMDLVVNLAALFCEKTKHHKIIHIPSKQYFLIIEITHGV
jgi:hypothetical protein